MLSGVLLSVVFILLIVSDVSNSTCSLTPALVIERRSVWRVAAILGSYTPFDTLPPLVIKL